MPKATLIPPDFPCAHRLGDAMLFRELLGNPGKSTFARYLQTCLIPPPDKKLGSLNRWYETTMAAALEALPGAREHRGEDVAKRSSEDARAAAL